MSQLREPVSGLTHLAGFFAAIAGLVLLLVLSSRGGGGWHVLSFTVYGGSLVALYLSSSLYHLLPLSEAGVRFMKRLDHISIFLLIAGSYTPFCLVALRGAWGWSLFGVAWGLAALGILFKLFWLYAPRWVVTGLYLGMGWVVVIAIVPLAHALNAGGLFWLFAGGFFYSSGAVTYALKRPDPWPGRFGFHEIWHLFVLAGSGAHFWAMLKYVLPMS